MNTPTTTATKTNTKETALKALQAAQGPYLDALKDLELAMGFSLECGLDPDFNTLTVKDVQQWGPVAVPSTSPQGLDQSKIQTAKFGTLPSQGGVTGHLLIPRIWADQIVPGFEMDFYDGHGMKRMGLVIDAQSNRVTLTDEDSEESFLLTVLWENR